MDFEDFTDRLEGRRARIGGRLVGVPPSSSGHPNIRLGGNLGYCHPSGPGSDPAIGEQSRYVAVIG
jgi:hypothetical protein